MRQTKFLSTLAISLLIASCGGKSEEATSKTSTSDSSSKPKDTIEAQTAVIGFLPSLPIEGEHAEYFAASGTDSTGKVIIVGSAPEEGRSQGTIRAVVKLDLKKQFPNLDGFSVFPPLSLYFLDEDKEEINSSRLTLSNADEDAIIAELKKSKPGEIEITYKGDFYPSSYNDIFKKVRYLQIQSAVLSDGSKSSTSSFEAEDDSESGDSSNNWDSILDDYEGYVDELVSLLPKIKSGDQSALTDYSSVSAQCVELCEDIQNEKSDMSSTQLARFNKILNKYTRAVSQM